MLKQITQLYNNTKANLDKTSCLYYIAPLHQRDRGIVRNIMVYATWCASFFLSMLYHYYLSLFKQNIHQSYYIKVMNGTLLYTMILTRYPVYIFYRSMTLERQRQPIIWYPTWCTSVLSITWQICQARIRCNTLIFGLIITDGCPTAAGTTSGATQEYSTPIVS